MGALPLIKLRRLAYEVKKSYSRAAFGGGRGWRRTDICLERGKHGNGRRNAVRKYGARFGTGNRRGFRYGRGETETPDTTDTWAANFVYDEETGKLSWDNYIEPQEISDISWYIVMVNGIYIDCMGLSGKWFEGPVPKPYAYLPLEIARYNYDHENALTGELEITVKYFDPLLSGWDINDENTIPCTDSFSYTFNGGELDTSLTVPQIAPDSQSISGSPEDDYTNLSVSFELTESIPEAIGVFYNITCDGYETSVQTYPLLHIGDTDISCYGVKIPNYIPDNTTFSIQLCTIDINGNRSEWSEPYPFATSSIDLPKYWKANFVYDEETGFLSWDSFIEQEKKAGRWNTA